MRWLSVLALGVAAWTGGAACGGDGPPGPELLDPARANTACRKVCSFNDDACYDPEAVRTDEDVAACIQGCLDYAGVWRGDVMWCWTLIDCAGDEMRECAAELEPAENLDEYEQVCTQRLSECFAGDPELSDIIWCECDPDTPGNLMSLVAPEVVDAMIGCLEQPCDQISQCYADLRADGAPNLFPCGGGN